MWKKSLYILMLSLCAILLSPAAIAEVEANTATAAELTSIRGIGSGTAQKIIKQRQEGSYKSWSDLIKRVKGIGKKKALKLSASGLSVNGQSWQEAKRKE